MIRTLLAASTVAVLLTVGVPAPAVGATGQEDDGGSIGIRLLEAPTDRRDDPRAQAYIVDHLAPGSSIDRALEVFNTTAAPADISLYAAGAVADDGFAFLEGRTGNELVDWMTVEPPSVRVPAGGTAEARVRIDVPTDASGGERYAVIWAELPATEGEVTTVNRVGIRIYLSVGPGGEPPSDFVVDSLQASRTADGLPRVTAIVRNTGGRALDVGGELSLGNGPGGVSAGPFPASPGTTVGTGAEAGVEVLLDAQLPDGPWDAELVLSSGRVERTATASITFPGAAGGVSEPAPAVTTGGARGPAVVLAFGLLFLMVLALLVLLQLRRRRIGSDEADAPVVLTRSG